LFSSPPGTEMVQFPGSSFRNLWIQSRMMAIQTIGLPHSAIRGSRDVCSSPRLFAAYHGLLRTAAPRHPPWTLSRLTILSSALQSAAQHARAHRPPRQPSRTCAADPGSPPTEQLPLRAPHQPHGQHGRLSAHPPLPLGPAAPRCAPLHPSLALSKTAEEPPRRRRGCPIEPPAHPRGPETAGSGRTLRSVGLVRVELTTSRLSGVRSNHLSYRPTWYATPATEQPAEGLTRVP
jgi:hypothetical protein